MIPNNQTNTVYYSEWLKKDFKDVFNNLDFKIQYNNYAFLPIKGTKDYWCRDYMPIQVNENKFVQFRYEPNYLKDDGNYRSNPKEIHKKLPFSNVTFSTINLDGGNIVNWKNKAILTDKIFKENPEYSNPSKLISELENLLEVELIIVPTIPGDPIGHIDAMLRFKDEHTLIGNDRKQEYPSWTSKLNKILKDHNLNYIDIPFLEKPKGMKEEDFGAIGLPINYLEVGNLIIVPLTYIDDNFDEKIIDSFEEIFPDREVDYIIYKDIAKHGGSLNCSTWNMYNKNFKIEKVKRAFTDEEVYDPQITVKGLKEAKKMLDRQPFGKITPLSKEEEEEQILKQNKEIN